MIQSDLVKGALIALASALLAQISVYVSEWIKYEREKKKLQHQRELTLKRDLYLPYVHALTEGAALLVAIPNTHHSEVSKLKLTTEAQNAIAAQNLIASTQVLKVVNAASRQLSEGMMRLMGMKMDEVKLAMDLDFAAKRLSELNNDNSSIIGRSRALKEAGTLTPEVAAALNEHFQSNQSEFTKLFAEQQEKFTQKNEILKNMTLQMMKELGLLAAASAPVLIELRRDLEIPTDEEAIINHFKDSLKFTEEVLPGFTEEIWSKATEGMNT